MHPHLNVCELFPLGLGDAYSVQHAGELEAVFCIINALWRCA